MYKKVIISVTVIYIILITVLSTINLSGKVDPIEVPYIDKLVHFCFYFAMNFLLILVVKVSKLKNISRWMLVTTLLSILYSIAIEIVQIYVGRAFELLDILANSTGAVLALLLMRSSFMNKYLGYIFLER